MEFKNSTANHTVANATDDLLDYTTETYVFIDPTWLLSMTIEFYFQYAIISIGIIGAGANGLVLYALIVHNAREAKKRAVNLMIIHQNLLDLTSCVLLIVTFSIRVSNIYLAGAPGFFICFIFANESAANCAIYGSTVNLISLTVERYLKVVHPFWSKKHLKRWMIYAAMVFSWIAGILANAPAAALSTVLVDGVCLGWYVWESTEHRMAYMTWSVISFFFLPLITFVYCYGRMVLVMRRQMRVMAGHNVGGSSQMNASVVQNKRVKWNIIKTMIIVSIAFVICWSPVHIYTMILNNVPESSTDLYLGYYPTVFMSNLYICMNPFIYAIKHDGVKRILTGLILCRKHEEGSGGDGPGSSGNSGGRTQKTQRS